MFGKVDGGNVKTMSRLNPAANGETKMAFTPSAGVQNP